MAIIDQQSASDFQCPLPKNTINGQSYIDSRCHLELLCFKMVIMFELASLMIYGYVAIMILTMFCCDNAKYEI